MSSRSLEREPRSVHGGTRGTTGEQMPEYRCYILDVENHIVQAHDIACETDAQAELTAAAMLAQDPYRHAAEVWRATRRVAKLQRGATPDLRPAPRARQPLGSVI